MHIRKMHSKQSRFTNPLMRNSSLFFIILFGFQFSAFAQEKASINGYVTNHHTGETLMMAHISLLEIERGTSSNRSGYYTLTNLEPGTYTLQASFIGFHSYHAEITLDPGENLRLNIDLVTADIQMDALVVEANENLEELRNIGMAQITPQLIQDLPAVIEPDLFRSVQLLPGVKAASDFSSGLYVRGGSPDQTLILLDETPIYNPSHFFGFFSIFNPDIIKDVRLYKGGYPAQYGGRIGSILSIYSKDGNRMANQGSVSVGLLASRLSFEGPFTDGSWSVAMRRSTLEPVLSVLRESVSNVPDQFFFYDINAKLNIDSSENNRYSFSVYSGYDRVSLPFQDDAQIGLRYGNRTLSGQWQRIFTDHLFGSFSLTGSYYFNEPNLEIAGTPFQRINEIYDFSLKGDIEYQPNEENILSTGFWAGSLSLRLLDRLDNTYTLNSSILSQYFSSYIQHDWQPHRKIAFNIGLRMNTFSEGDYLRLEPRASAELRISQRFRIQAAYGRYNQFLTLITNEAFSGFDVWLAADEGVPPAFGDQFLLGLKTLPFSGYGFDVEVYYRTMRNLFELDPFAGNTTGLDYQDLFRFGEGYAYGAEFFFEKQMGNLTGFIGYTFGITERKFPGFNHPVLDSPAQARFYPPKYDRTHDANLVFNYLFTSRWSIGAVFNYSTGQAYTEPQGRTQLSGPPWDRGFLDVFIIEKLNSSRLPSYHRLDMSLSRKGTFFGIGDAEWQLQVINVYSRRNIWFYNYNFDENPVKRQDITLLPVIPSIAYTINF